ncbi:hypothetical protein B1778_00885 [Dehalococcoides mccartyi]|uniref:DUF262 domain-containing protein n=1 Tax=Dehalococcoides mccartyi TaxID=61435 RepID=UPI00098EBE60|nr:DUF262 domain-containing protein [Dehalococcoides mccartyi]AQU05326.1 hypothetical protein B1777_01030 [Dehalococcoides mccartyi]AQU06779.1 hypothetical protein B1778_00885 [Dehalococcoides mccartyi]
MSSMTIKPDYQHFDDLLQKRLFRVPEYQRAYSWGSQQRKELFFDITKLHQQNIERNHFMATIVCLQTGKKEEVGVDEYGVFDIVDGQQRLTTLIIILKALSKKLGEGSNIQKREAKKLDELLVKGDQRLILLQTNHDSSLLFRKYLLDEALPAADSVGTASEKNLIDAVKECEEFVIKWPDDPLVLLKIVKNRLDFVFYALDDEGAVYTIFEVLNSRGLEVDWLDKCKSVLMGIAFNKFKGRAGSEHIKEIHKRWTKIYETIGLDKIPGHEILRFAATLRQPDEPYKIMSSHDALEFLRNYCEENPALIINVTDDFLEIAKSLDKLNENPRWRAVTDILHARFLAVAIMYNTYLNDKEKSELLDVWENVTFQIFGLCRKDARHEVSTYTRPAHRIANGKMTKTEVARNINVLRDVVDVNSAIDKFKGGDCYFGWSSRDLLYFFYRYEEFLAKQAGAAISTHVWEQIWRASPETTIEHIFPENPGAEWRGKLGKGIKPESQVHRLGNLMLLPPNVNSQAGRKSFIKKKEIYRNNRNLRMVEEILRKREWNKQAIEDREKKLLKWAKYTWCT